MKGGAVPPDPEKTVEIDIILFDSGINSTYKTKVKHKCVTH